MNSKSLLLCALCAFLGFAAASQTGGFSTNQYPTGVQDQAFTTADQALLNQLRRETQPVMGGAGGWSPVHFICRQGVVTLAGDVASTAEKHQLISIVRNTAGVTRVVDELQVGAKRTGSAEQFVPADTAGAVQPYGSAPAAPSAPSAPLAPAAPVAPGLTAFGDQAFTGADQDVLVQLRHQLLPVLGPMENAAPVHFFCRNGMVTVVGHVPSAEEQQRIMQIVQQTPGVTKVINNLQVTVDANSTANNVGGGSAPQSNGFIAGSTNAFALMTNPPPTTSSNLYGINSPTNGGNYAASTNSYGSATNLAPTGTNVYNRVYGTSQAPAGQNGMWKMQSGSGAPQLPQAPGGQVPPQLNGAQGK